MQLISVNVGEARAIENAKDSGFTGIYKMPVEAPVQITARGLHGDAICDTKHHGGVDQAVYIYGAADYDWWATLLGLKLAPGTFGENLTISELETAGSRVGDRFHVGTTILEVTGPRIPCVTLSVRMGDPVFGRVFREVERPGLYCRVIQEGQVQVGDLVWVDPYAGETVTAIEMFREAFGPALSEAALRRCLAAPIAVRERAKKEAKLRTLLAQR